MRIGAFDIVEPVPEINQPHVISTLRPWIDAGSAGTLTLSWLEKHCQAQRTGKLSKPGTFFDFTRYRPTLVRREGQRQLIIPNTRITSGKMASGADFLFVHLLEPHMFGEKYVESVLQLFDTFGIQSYCLIGSMYDFVPHTRRFLVTGASTGKQLGDKLAGADVMSSDYEGPTTITNLISEQLSEKGIECLTLIVHLPQYTQLDEDYIGTARLMEILSVLYGIPVDDGYIKKADQQRVHLNSALERNPDLQAILGQLEAHYDARAREGRREDASHLSPEIEKFLREMERRFRQN
jgi:hypothetical protein